MIGAAALVCLLFLSLLLVVVHAKLTKDTLACYESNSKTIVGGSTEMINFNLGCSSCKNQELCPPGLDFCFWLETHNLHAVRNGTISQTLELSDCSPLRLVMWEPQAYFVQCESMPQSSYRPTHQEIYRENENSEFHHYGDPRTEQANVDFARVADNNVLLFNTHKELYLVAMLENSNELFITYGGEDYHKAISGCSTLTRLIAGPIFDTGDLQLVVDCSNELGETVRQQVLIPSDNLWADLTVNTLPAPLANDSVEFSKNGRYIRYMGTSQVKLVQKAQPNGLPGILDYNGPVVEANFIANSSALLVSVPGQNREIIELNTYFESSFESGRTVLQNTEAYCPQGKCPPSVDNNGRLYLFVVDPSSPSYLLLVSYHISDLSQPPLRINRVLRRVQFETCYHINADIDYLTDINDLIDSSSTTEAVTTLATPAINSSDASVGGQISQTQDQDLSGPLGGGVSAGLFVAIVMVVIIITIVYKERRTRSKKNGSTVRQDTSPHLPIPVVMVTLSNDALSTPGTSCDPSLSSRTSSQTNIDREGLSQSPVPETNKTHEKVPHPSHRTTQQAF